MTPDVNQCELKTFYKFLGSKWTLMLLHVFREAPLTFNEIHRFSGRHISTFLLSRRIKQMQQYNIIEQKDVEGHLSYAITDQGKRLKELLHMLKEWGVDNDLNIPDDCKSGECKCDRIRKILTNP